MQKVEDKAVIGPSDQLVWTAEDNRAAMAQGWCLFDFDGGERKQIQKCDETDLLVDDIHAFAFVYVQADQGCPVAIKALQLDDGLPITLRLQFGSDVDVVEVAGLDPEYADRFEKPWLTVEADGTVHPFESEDDACSFQRLYRACAGFNPHTGEAAAKSYGRGLTCG